MLVLLLSLLAQAAAPRHPCTPAEDLGPDRYARKSMVVYGLQGDDEVVVEGADSYSGTAPDGASLAGASDLIRSVSAGLFTVDYPLERFDAWLTRSAPNVQGDTLVGGGALACTDAAVIPSIAGTSLEIGEGASYKLNLQLTLDLYQRDDAGVLVKTRTLKAKAPSPLDAVEDMMSSARQQAVGQVKDAIPDSDKHLKRAKTTVDTVSNLLPPDQAAKLDMVVEQTQLGATRVASIARTATLLPQLEGGTEQGELGIRWRAVENRCFIEAPEPEDDDFASRTLECLVLNRARQATRKVQLDTRRVPDFRLFAPVAQLRARKATMPLGAEEGTRVGDGYFFEVDGRRKGYAKVTRVGAGGADGTVAPSRLQRVYGGEPTLGVSAKEDPRLGIEIAGWGGLIPAHHASATLPDDPIEGGARSLPGASQVPAGKLRFDVDLGRMAKAYDWYQTNRVGGTMVGEDLIHIDSAFGLEKRLLVLPRTYLTMGAAAGFQMWNLPSGITELDEEGEESEVRASANTIGAEGDGGLVVMVTPSILVRASVGGRWSPAVSQFKWATEDQEGTVVPETLDGSAFALNSTGWIAGMSTAWVF